MTCDLAAVEATDAAVARALVIEDHQMLAEALAHGLDDLGFETQVVEVPTAEAAYEEAALLRPALILLDLDLDGFDGLDLVARLRSTGARVLVVTGCRDEARLAAAVALGAAGWVRKTEPFEVMLEAAATVARGDSLLGVSRREQLIELGRARLVSESDVRTRASLLTPREREVLAALSQGTSAQTLAEELVISLGTVRAHIRSILMKLGVSTQLAAVAVAQHLVAERYGIGGDDVRSTLAAASSRAVPATFTASCGET